MSKQDEVRMASKRFYAALSRMANGDAGSLSDVWSHGADVTTMHPIGGRQVGWDAVRASFEQVAQSAADGKVDLEEQLIRVTGDFAYEVGVERGRFMFAGQQVPIDCRVTNIYQHQAGEWRIIHHHTDISSAMSDVVKRLEGARGAGGR